MGPRSHTGLARPSRHKVRLLDLILLALGETGQRWPMESSNATPRRLLDLQVVSCSEEEPT